jgi:RNA polymerase sigma factor (sigma-70 family)
MTVPTCSLRGDEASLYARHHRRLEAAVRLAVNASPALVEDACQAAWLILLRRQPDRGPRLFRWLRTVAVHEAYALSARERRDLHLEDLDGGDAGEGWQAVIRGPDDFEARLEARRALRAVARLPDRQRRYVVLHVAGHRYGDIAELDGATHTAVNRHLTRGRAALRDLAAQTA